TWAGTPRTSTASLHRAESTIRSTSVPCFPDVSTPQRVTCAVWVTGIRGPLEEGRQHRSRPSPTRSCSDGAPAGRDHHGRPFRLVPCGWLLLLVGWQPVRCHPEAVARGAAHHDVIDGAVAAGEGKAFGDLGRDIAVRARYGGQHCSASGCMSRRP